MRASARRFRIALDEAHLRDAIAAARAGGGLVRVRLDESGRVRATGEPLDPMEQPVRVILSSARVDSRDPWLRVKSAWRPGHRRAAAQAHEFGCFDALLCNERGELTEGARTNLFVEADGTLWTPPLACGLLPGILREDLLAGGIARERVLYPSDLARADAVYVGNSARGLLRAELREAAISRSR
jgi:branched-subunit amino acid aminotransferase/4-amino-4-deoxychorismate lyase